MEREPNSLTLSQEELRVLARWAVACAERAIKVFEAAAPSDPRPQEQDLLSSFLTSAARTTPARCPARSPPGTPVRAAARARIWGDYEAGVKADLLLTHFADGF